jgi:hypothetical protein
MTWINPPCDVPTVFLSTVPNMIWPSSINMPSSSAGLTVLDAEPRYKLIPDGMHIDRICLPVQSGFGFMMAGGGITPSHSGTHRRMFWTKSRSMKQSRRVNLRTPHSVSWTIPMTGLLACGEMMLRGTAQMLINSARVSSDCGTCKFISSPSKSALYGDVTDKLSRKVEYGMSLTRCAIIDILCSDGCRLNKTMSPSLRWRSTIHPYWRNVSARLLYLRSIRSPVSRTTYRAPGYSFGPFRTSSWRYWMLYGVTRSG